VLRLRAEVDDRNDREFVVGPSPSTRAILGVVQKVAKLPATGRYIKSSPSARMMKKIAIPPTA